MFDDLSDLIPIAALASGVLTGVMVLQIFTCMLGARLAKVPNRNFANAFFASLLATPLGSFAFGASVIYERELGAGGVLTLLVAGVVVTLVVWTLAIKALYRSGAARAFGAALITMLLPVAASIVQLLVTGVISEVIR